MLSVEGLERLLLLLPSKVKPLILNGSPCWSVKELLLRRFPSALSVKRLVVLSLMCLFQEYSVATSEHNIETVLIITPIVFPPGPRVSIFFNSSFRPLVNIDNRNSVRKVSVVSIAHRLSIKQSVVARGKLTAARFFEFNIARSSIFI